MTSRVSQRRSGITLTEILISILIMGVGLLSLATLFPLGILRLREASRATRSAFLAESATGDLSARNLLSKATFFQTWYGYDPFVNDRVSSTGRPPIVARATGVLGGAAPTGTNGGLPIAYDPFWRAQAHIAPAEPVATTLPAGTVLGIHEARFAAGVVDIGGGSLIPFVRDDPAGGIASAHGLQRITNFVPQIPALSYWPLSYPAQNTISWPSFAPDAASGTFASPDDVVFQSASEDQVISFNPNAIGVPSGVVPDLGVSGTYSTDLKYTWMFTGRQSDVTNGTLFDGDIVIMDSRPFAFDPVVSPTIGTQATLAAGETVIEAIYGYNTVVFPAAQGYAVGADRAVLLRWPAALPDPEIKTGTWIADVTYERDLDISNARRAEAKALEMNVPGFPVYSMQRCHWYRISKTTPVQDDPLLNGYRRVIVQVATPLKAKTLLNRGGNPVHVNVALFMPSVINVFPRSFTASR